jgi:hypothetical protein
MLLEDFGVAWAPATGLGRVAGSGVVTSTHMFPSRVEAESPETLYADLVHLYEVLASGGGTPETAPPRERPFTICLHSHAGQANAELSETGLEEPSPAAKEPQPEAAPVRLLAPGIVVEPQGRWGPWIVTGSVAVILLGAAAWFVSSRSQARSAASPVSGSLSGRSPSAAAFSPSLTPETAEPAAEITPRNNARPAALPPRTEQAAPAIEEPPAIAPEPGATPIPSIPLPAAAPSRDDPQRKAAALRALGINAGDQTKRKAAVSALTGEQ